MATGIPFQPMKASAARARSLLKRSAPAPVVRSGLALMASTGATSVLGLVFWVVAAHLVRATVVGRASAEVSALALLATLSQLNLVNIYTRFLPRSGNRARRFVAIGYSACIAIGLVVAAAFVALGGGHAWLHPGVENALLFIGAVGLWTIFVLQDSVLTGLRAAKWVPVENASFSAAKLILVIVLASLGAPGIVLAWVIPVVPAVAFVNLYLFRRRIPDHHLQEQDRSEFPSRKTLRNFVIAEYGSSVVGNSASYLTPLIIIAVLGARSGAYFYLPWLIGTVASVLLWNISTSFVVEAGYQRENPKLLLRRSCRLAVAVMLPVIVVLLAGAAQILDIAGAGYSSGGTMLLRLIALAIIPTGITMMYEMFAWYEGAVWRLVAEQTLRIGLFFVLTAVLLHTLHVDAAGVGLLASESIFAVILFRPTMRRWRTLSAPPSVGGAEGIVTSVP
jgi:O-antigen/teichoic acid export membrane protein